MVYGDEGNDELDGGPGDGDRVYGEEGDDALYGGSGVMDYCSGGAGTNTAVDSEDTLGIP